jgi:hypothetical protein
MVVVMCVATPWQHAGREIPLAVGQSYDLPEAVATELIASGSAMHIAAPVLEMESAPMPVLETKRGRRRAA